MRHVRSRGDPVYVCELADRVSLAAGVRDLPLARAAAASDRGCRPKKAIEEGTLHSLEEVTCRLCVLLWPRPWPPRSSLSSVYLRRRHICTVCRRHRYPRLKQEAREELHTGGRGVVDGTKFYCGTVRMRIRHNLPILIDTGSRNYSVSFSLTLTVFVLP